MAETEIPQDVLETARNHWADATMEAYPGGVMSSIDIIARAILAERERCAKVADAEAARLTAGYAGIISTVGGGTAKSIASSIRSGAQHE